ncbi:hypothetical protein F383_37525 [Gossypium arboreum]|uniref:Uncharacterized protein n=1 Tax=Gossypium arboreum TaxID=29729 RepID=A0A0B0MH45_GOSAR|nr:hypothetical protein F383_37525 [Gossypium arboreum]
MFCTQESIKSQKKQKTSQKRDKTDQIEKMTQPQPCHTDSSHARVFRGCRPRLSRFTWPGH